jgi:hypothetical protein
VAKVSGQKRKRNHWVAQSYLRNFAADPDRRAKIWTMSKTAGEPELKPIEKVAVKFYLYAPNGPKGRDYSFEEKLSSLEQLFGLRGWAEISTGAVDLCDPTMRKSLSLLAAVMFLRNPLRLAMTHDLHRQIVDRVKNLPQLPTTFEYRGRVHELDTSNWPEYRDANEDDVKRMWIDQIQSARWLAEILMPMRWSMFVSEAPTFIATDNPVAVMHPELGFRGFRNPQTLVVFPLSPTRVLVMDNRKSEPDGQYYIEANPGVLNVLLWRESIDLMYTHRHPDLVCAEMALAADKLEGVPDWSQRIKP